MHVVAGERNQGHLRVTLGNKMKAGYDMIS